MSRAFNLFSRYSPDQLLARRAKITGNPRNLAPAGASEAFKRAPCRQLEDIELALEYHAIAGKEAMLDRISVIAMVVLPGLTIVLQLFWSTP